MSVLPADLLQLAWTILHACDTILQEIIGLMYHRRRACG